MSDHLTRLEESLLFLERHVEQLDATVRQLQDRLDDVQTDLARVRLQIEQQQVIREAEADEELPGSSA